MTRLFIFNSDGRRNDEERKRLKRGDLSYLPGKNVPCIHQLGGPLFAPFGPLHTIPISQSIVLPLGNWTLLDHTR